MNKIDKICKLILKIEDSEVKEQREIFRGQEEYISPLKLATQARQNNLGKYNNEVLDKLLELKNLMGSGKDLITKIPCL